MMDSVDRSTDEDATNEPTLRVNALHAAARTGSPDSDRE